MAPKYETVYRNVNFLQHETVSKQIFQNCPSLNIFFYLITFIVCLFLINALLYLY